MLYSVGYERHTIDDFVALLVEHGVATLVDVRLNPISRKPGFSKRRLAEALGAVGVDYRHEPLLGNQADNRSNFHPGGDLETGHRRYAARLDGSSADALRRLATMASRGRLSVLCVERDSEWCHRRVITDRLQQLLPSLTVQDREFGTGSVAFWSYVEILIAEGVVYAWAYVGSGRSIAAVIVLLALTDLAGETLWRRRCGHRLPRLLGEDRPRPAPPGWMRASPAGRGAATPGADNAAGPTGRSATGPDQAAALHRTSAARRLRSRAPSPDRTR